MRCASCERPFPAGAESVAAISISELGDELVYSYWKCPACRAWTVEAYRDRFLGEPDIGFLPPLDEAEGDRAVALIRACPAPWDKTCDCASHKAMSGGRPG